MITGAPVTVGIVTWNSAACLESCLASVRAQTHRPVELLVVDNHSADGTRPLLERLTAPGERVQLDRNTGFSSAHNLAIRRTRGTYYLALNPDVILAPDFVSVLAQTLDVEPHAGAATGKLRLADEPARLDSTGIVMVPEQRHFDRGQGQVDRGQYDRTEPVFGASGAAAFLRREMLDDVAIEGEVFDEDFFAYREDVDLAWRAQWRGWRCLYVPIGDRPARPSRAAGTADRPAGRHQPPLRAQPVPPSAQEPDARPGRALPAADAAEGPAGGGVLPAPGAVVAPGVRRGGETVAPDPAETPDHHGRPAGGAGRDRPLVRPVVAPPGRRLARR